MLQAEGRTCCVLENTGPQVETFLDKACMFQYAIQIAARMEISQWPWVLAALLSHNPLLRKAGIGGERAQEGRSTLRSGCRVYPDWLFSGKPRCASPAQRPLWVTGSLLSVTGRVQDACSSFWLAGSPGRLLQKASPY